MSRKLRFGGLILVSWLAVFTAIGWIMVSTEYARVAATSSLHEAAFHRDIGKVAALITAGHSVDEIDEERVFGVRIRSYPYSFEYGVTPLYVAACRSDAEMIEYLLKHGANPNHRCSGPYTILGRAASMFGGSIDIHGTGLPPEIPTEIKLRVLVALLHAGANPDERKYDGAETPLEICKRMEVPDAERLFTSHSRNMGK